MSDEGQKPRESEPEELDDFEADAERIMSQAKRPAELPDVPTLDETDSRNSFAEQLMEEGQTLADLPEVPEWTYERTQHPAGRTADPATYSRGMGLAIAIGMSFLGPVLAGVFIGYLIDGKMGGTAGVVGIVLGSALAMVLLVRLVNRLNADE